MRRYPSVLASFHGQPLALLPSKLDEIRALLLARAEGAAVSDEYLAEIMAARRSDGVQIVGRVAVLPVFGAIAQRMGMMEKSSGGVSTEEIGATLENLCADKAVRSVVMVFDSPGGTVTGTPELADKIRSLTAKKKIVASVDPMAASAAYWLAAQCSEINVTPSGQVGSIGVLCAHEDRSAKMEAKGVKTTYVTSEGAPFKVEGAPEYPLTDEAKAEMQGKVDFYHAMFVKAIAKGRNVTEARVAADFGGGRMVTAKDAVARGMADRVATLEQVLSRMGAEGGSGGMSASRMAVELATMEDE